MDCLGEHHYFCAEVVGVPDEGQVHVLIFCTSCGDFKQHSLTVSQKGSSIRLLREETRREAK